MRAVPTAPQVRSATPRGMNNALHLIAAQNGPLDRAEVYAATPRVHSDATTCALQALQDGKSV